MAYSIFARDGTSRIVLKRESREAAERKARELTDLVLARASDFKNRGPGK